MRLPRVEIESGSETHAHQERGQWTSPLAEEVGALFEQFRNPLFRYLLSLGVPPHEGEEVIQEVFLALFRHLKEGKPRDHLRGWIFRVGHNLALKLRGREQAPLLDNLPDPEPDPEEQALEKQRQQRLSAVVSALPEQDRACLALRAEGLRYREIAEVLGMSLGSVSISLSRSLARLSRVHER